MIFFLAGTSDARALALAIKAHGYPLLASVVSENAAANLRCEGINVHVGRLDQAGMAAIITNKQLKLVIDATHPFAAEASVNAIAAAEYTNIPYIRFERKMESFSSKLITYAADYLAAAMLAEKKPGVIMLTTGSKTLDTFTERLLGRKNTRLIVRLLPTAQNIEKCRSLGIAQQDIVAVQGPFSQMFNRALFQHYGVTLLVTKDSGAAGAVGPKIAAALDLDIETVMIRRPQLNYGTIFSDFDDVFAAINAQGN